MEQPGRMGEQLRSNDQPRFLSQDTYTGNAWEPWSQNLYSYVGNNPVNMVDPTGHWPEWNKLGRGGALLTIGAIAVAGALVVVTAGAATPLLIAAGVTASAGTITMAYGSADVVESFTGHNAIKDTIYNGDEEAYKLSENLSVAFSGLSMLGTGGFFAAATNAATATIASYSAQEITYRVIGHDPDYIKVSSELGLKAFQLPPDVSVKMTEQQVWSANLTFLQRAVDKGAEFILATPLNEMKANSFYEAEIEFLKSKGYEYVEQFGRMMMTKP